MKLEGFFHRLLFKQISVILIYFIFFIRLFMLREHFDLNALVTGSDVKDENIFDSV